MESFLFSQEVTTGKQFRKCGQNGWRKGKSEREAEEGNSNKKNIMAFVAS